jgi:hypothetical protein
LTLFEELEEEGELMTAWDYDKNGDLVCVGYGKPVDGKIASEEDKKKVYLCASQSVLDKDAPAAQLLNEYLGNIEVEKGMEVFTFKNIGGETGTPEDANRGKRRRGPGKRAYKMNLVNLRPDPKAPKLLPRFKRRAPRVPAVPQGGVRGLSSFLGKKYKPVADKVKPILAELPQKFRIERNIKGDPLAEMPTLNPCPPEFEAKGRYTDDRREVIEALHNDGLLEPEERKLMHHFMMEHEKSFAWDENERGKLKHEFFPPVDMPVVRHTPWVCSQIPIPPGHFEEFCKNIKQKIDAGVYEPSNSSYRSPIFAVIKKDGKSLRIVHALERLNEVTIQHSGVTPGTEALAEHFAGRACGGTLDMFVGYDNRDLAEGSRDYTTFQTPFGAMRLVKLPMGWTNSVPIFHDDVTYILQEEIPHVTIPYIDDVPVRGPATRYETEEGDYERIPENKGIRRFVWEHFQNLNRVVTRMIYAGGTFSGKKAVLCKDVFEVVGHTCSYKGRIADPGRVEVISNWGKLANFSQVKAYLGTVGVLRMFIKDYAKIVGPINDLTKKGVPFVWGDAQDKAQADVRDALENCEPLKPLNYEWDSDIVIQVDTSWRAVGIIIYQCDPKDPKIRHYARFASITLGERESQYSQPKRELYGLMRALEAMSYWIFGARKLVVETDALYIRGMLKNPGMGPNATINRWIEKILMFHFQLKHVPGATFAPDGLSRRDPHPGDEVFKNSEEGYDENAPPEDHEDVDETGPMPLDFEEFKHKIDTRGGYLQMGESADSPEDFANERKWSADLETQLRNKMAEHSEQNVAETEQYVQASMPLIPDLELKWDPEKREPYEEEHRSLLGKQQDNKVLLLRKWLEDPLVRPKDIPRHKYRAFVRWASHFFLKEGRLYKKSLLGSAHQLVVDKEHRMYMLKAAHDSLGHRGFFATKELIALRFWWPEMDRDVSWYVRTCHMCQVRQHTLLRIPPVVTHTPSIFEVIHVDVMKMGATSNGYDMVVDARDSLSRWLEARPIKNDNAETLGMFLLEEIICRWGCPKKIVTDNAKQFIKAVAWLEAKYGIQHILISPYNSQGNGNVENGHFPMRQSLFKATGGNPAKWFYFFHQVLWADRITIRKGMGCSPFFLVTGAHPILPLDIEEATWLVEIPGRVLTDSELIGFRAQALAKHSQHVEAMRARVDYEKRVAVRKYERYHEHTIVNYDFEPGRLVLVRYTKVEKSLDKKMNERYLGPMIVIRRTLGGAYLVAEMNGAMFQDKIAAFRVIPYEARHSIPIPQNIHKLIDISKETLDDLVNDKARKAKSKTYKGKDLQFSKVRLRVTPEEFEESESSDNPDSEADNGQQSADLENEDQDALRRSKRSINKLGGRVKL